MDTNYSQMIRSNLLYLGNIILYTSFLSLIDQPKGSPKNYEGFVTRNYDIYIYRNLNCYCIIQNM